MTFAELKTQFIDYLNRADLSATLQSLFVNNALRKLERRYNFRYMETRDTTSTITDGEMTVPTRYKNTIYFYAIASNEYTLLTKGSPRFVIGQETTTSTGVPLLYARIKNIAGDDKFRFRPTSTGSYTIDFYYRTTSAELSGDSDTNWWTLNHPEILIYGAVLESIPYLDITRSTMEKGFVDDTKTAYNEALKEILDNEREEILAGSPQATGASYVR